MGDGDTVIGVTSLILFLLMAYWSLRGIGQLFERYNPLLALLYLFLLFPIAFLHAFLLGIFGKSKEQRMQEAIEDEVDFQLNVEKEKERRMY